METHDSDSSRSPLGGSAKSPGGGVSGVTSRTIPPEPAKRPLSEHDQEFVSIFGEPVRKADHVKKKKTSKIVEAPSQTTKDE